MVGLSLVGVEGLMGILTWFFRCGGGVGEAIWKIVPGVS